MTEDEIPFPDYPTDRSEFELALEWASGYFGVAKHVELGLDEGQSETLAAIVRRIDQLAGELRENRV